MPAHETMLPMGRFVFYPLAMSGYPLQKCLEIGLLGESRYCQVNKIKDYIFKTGDANDEINNVESPMDNKWHGQKEGPCANPSCYFLGCGSPPQPRSQWPTSAQLWAPPTSPWEGKR